MKTKKIRGHKRRQRGIAGWVMSNLTLDLSDLIVRERDYVKIRVRPWSDLSVTTSIIPPPKGITRKQMILGLLDIYESWQTKLGSLGRPFYLKIWLFEPRFSQSQVVCGIGDKIESYDNAFYKPGHEKKLNPANYGKLQQRMSQFQWEFGLDEDQHQASDIGDAESWGSLADYEETKIWFERLMRKPHRTWKSEQEGDGSEDIHFFKRGHVWIGGK